MGKKAWACPGAAHRQPATGADSSTASAASLPLQYYIYADFTENPGNQCFVHGTEAQRCRCSSAALAVTPDTNLQSAPAASWCLACVAREP